MGIWEERSEGNQYISQCKNWSNWDGGRCEIHGKKCQEAGWRLGGSDLRFSPNYDKFGLECINTFHIDYTFLEKQVLTLLWRFDAWRNKISKLGHTPGMELHLLEVRWIQKSKLWRSCDRWKGRREEIKKIYLILFFIDRIYTFNKTNYLVFVL